MIILIGTTSSLYVPVVKTANYLLVSDGEPVELVADSETDAVEFARQYSADKGRTGTAHLVRLLPSPYEAFPLSSGTYTEKLSDLSVSPLSPSTLESHE